MAIYKGGVLITETFSTAEKNKLSNIAENANALSILEGTGISFDTPTPGVIVINVTNVFSSEDKTKLDGIQAEANKLNISAGARITIDDTDPTNLIISADEQAGSGGTSFTITAGDRILIDDTDPTNLIISAEDQAVTASPYGAIQADTAGSGKALIVGDRPPVAVTHADTCITVLNSSTDIEELPAYSIAIGEKTGATALSSVTLGYGIAMSGCVIGGNVSGSAVSALALNTPGASQVIDATGTISLSTNTDGLTTTAVGIYMDCRQTSGSGCLASLTSERAEVVSHSGNKYNLTLTAPETSADIDDTEALQADVANKYIGAAPGIVTVPVSTAKHGEGFFLFTLSQAFGVVDSENTSTILFQISTDSEMAYIEYDHHLGKYIRLR
jgi:hypothetical protein